jgi:hypothetical protein
MVNWSHVQTLFTNERGKKALLLLAILGLFSNVNGANNSGIEHNNTKSENGNDINFHTEKSPMFFSSDCFTALPINPSPSGSCSFEMGVTVGPNYSPAFPCAFSGTEEYLDAWYIFVAQSTDITFTSGTGNPFAVIYNGTDCGNLVPFSSGCIRGSGTVTGFTIGQSYLIQVLTHGTTGTSFSFCLEGSQQAPANDLCENASSIVLGDPFTFDASYARVENPPACTPFSSLNLPDLWYTFNGPENQEIAFANTSGKVLLSIYSGTCGSLNLIACAIPNATAPDNLNPGETYYAQLSLVGTENSTEETITSPNSFTFTGANSNNWSDGTNWQSGTPPPGSQPVTLTSGTNCVMDVNVTMNSALNLEPGSSLIIDETLTLNNTLTNNGDLDISGTLKGNGTLVQNGTLTSTGTLAPGLSPGTLTITGDYDMDGTTYDCEINGTTAGTQYDVINVSGNASLTGGTLNVTWGFTPAHSQTFEILSCGSRTGSFSTVNIAPVTNRTFTVNYLPFGVSILSQSSLPVEFLSFTGRLSESGAISLDWQTGTEIENEGFEIQRLKNNTKWVTIGFISGYGNSTITRNYNFMDYEPEVGSNYYRIRQIDFDGSDSYSKTIAIETDLRDEPLVVYPNPANNSTTIEIQQEVDENGMISITDINQKIIRQISLESRNNSGKRDIDLTNLPSGIYFLHLETAKTSFTKRLVVQHNHN